MINRLLTGSDVASYERHPKAKALLTPPGVSGHTLTHTHGRACNRKTVTHTHEEKHAYPHAQKHYLELVHVCIPLSGSFGLLPDCSSQTKFGL